MKKFVSAVLIACIVGMAAPHLNLNLRPAYALDFSEIDIDFDELDLGRLAQFGISREVFEEFYNHHRRPGHMPPPPPRHRHRPSRIEIYTEDLLETLLELLIEDAIKNRDVKNESKSKAKSKSEAKAKNEDKSETESEVKSSESPQLYDELVNICRSGSLKDFKAKCKEHDLAGDAVIAYKNRAEGRALISIAAEHSPNSQIVKFLLDNNADAMADDGAPLRLAAGNARPDTVKLLLYAGADAAQADELGRTALSYAAANYFDVANRLDVIKALRIAGADFNLRDKSGMSPWAYAVQSGAPEIVNYFLDNGADARLSNIYNLAKGNARLKGTQALKRIEAVNKRVKRK